MAEQAGAELEVDAVRRMGKYMGAQGAEHRLEDRDRHEADDQNVERAHAAMYEHLVDDDLEEQRRDKREDLQEERGRQDLPEQVTVFVNGTEKPGDVEAPRQGDQCGPPRPAHATAFPDGVERVPR